MYRSLFIKKSFKQHVLVNSSHVHKIPYFIPSRFSGEKEFLNRNHILNKNKITIQSLPVNNSYIKNLQHEFLIKDNLKYNEPIKENKRVLEGNVLIPFLIILIFFGPPKFKVFLMFILISLFLLS